MVDVEEFPEVIRTRNEQEFLDALQTQVDVRDQERTELLAAYQVMNQQALRRVLLIEYQCLRSTCLLLHAWRGPTGDGCYIPAYKLEVTRNAAASTESGRRANTTDGERRWKPQAGRLADLSEWFSTAGLALNCDHVQTSVAIPTILSDAAAASPGHPTRRKM